MSLNEDLYKDIIIEYSQNPRHYGEMKNPTIKEEGVNRSCGDEIQLYLQIFDNRIEKVQYTGQGCSICMASTEMMSTFAENQDVEEVMNLISRFKDMILNSDDVSLPDKYQDLESLKGVKKFPIRVKCATLSWNTLEQAISQFKSKK